MLSAEASKAREAIVQFIKDEIERIPANDYEAVLLDVQEYCKLQYDHLQQLAGRITDAQR